MYFCILWFKVACSPRHTHVVPKLHLDGQHAANAFFNTRRRHNAQKMFPFLPGAHLGGLGLVKNGRKRMFKFWFKVGSSPRRTRIVRKWHVDGQPAERKFFNVRMRCGAEKQFPFTQEAHLGYFGLLRNGGMRMFQILIQVGVFLAIYPNSAQMGVG